MHTKNANVEKNNIVFLHLWEKIYIVENWYKKVCGIIDFVLF